MILNTTITSQLAFRVECNRVTKDVKIFAGGFDYLGDLFLGSDAQTWETELTSPDGSVEAPLVDGGITAGLHLWKPDPVGGSGTFSGQWYEISAMGVPYHLRANGKQGDKAEGMDRLNSLTDGCVIVNAENVFLFSMVPPSGEDRHFLTNEVLETILKQEKTIICPITMDPISLHNSMISGPLRPDFHVPGATLDLGQTTMPCIQIAPEGLARFPAVMYSNFQHRRSNGKLVLAQHVARLGIYHLLKCRQLRHSLSWRVNYRS